MILDAQAEFSDSQLVTASAVSTNVYDTAPMGRTLNRDLGAGSSAYLGIQVDTTATAAGAATVTITLESSANADLSASTVHATYGPYTLAQLTGGSTLTLSGLPSANYARYVGLRYTVATGPLTAGAFSAFITTTPAAFRAYPRAYNV